RPGRRRRGPRALNPICGKPRKRAPPRRYPSAAALADDLNRFLAREPIRARPVGRLERAARWCRRHPAVTALTAAVVVLLLVVLIGASVVAWSLHQERNEALTKLCPSYLDPSRAARAAGQWGRRQRCLAQLTEAARIRFSPELRDEAIAWLALADLQVGREWPGDPTLWGLVDFDGTLERYARSERGDVVSVRRTADDVELARLPTNAP